MNKRVDKRCLSTTEVNTNPPLLCEVSSRQYFPCLVWGAREGAASSGGVRSGKRRGPIRPCCQARARASATAPSSTAEQMGKGADLDSDDTVGDGDGNQRLAAEEGIDAELGNYKGCSGGSREGQASALS